MGGAFAPARRALERVRALQLGDLGISEALAGHLLILACAAECNIPGAAWHMAEAERLALEGRRAIPGMDPGAVKGRPAIWCGVNSLSKASAGATSRSFKRETTAERFQDYIRAAGGWVDYPEAARLVRQARRKLLRKRGKGGESK
jgi:hypothetical protein